MLSLELENVVQVEVRWLELNLAQNGLIVPLLDLLELLLRHSLLGCRGRPEPAAPGHGKVIILLVLDGFLFLRHLVLVERLLFI